MFKIFFASLGVTLVLTMLVTLSATTDIQDIYTTDLQTNIVDTLYYKTPEELEEDKIKIEGGDPTDDTGNERGPDNSGVENAKYLLPYGTGTATYQMQNLLGPGKIPAEDYVKVGVVLPSGSVTYTDTHEGLDIYGYNTSGTKNVQLAASEAGTVIATDDGHPSNNAMVGNFGNYVILAGADGKSTMYAHMLPNTLKVKVGDSVIPGQDLGTQGSSGYSSGDHLHLEIVNTLGSVANGNAAYDWYGSLYIPDAEWFRISVNDGKFRKLINVNDVPLNELAPSIRGQGDTDEKKK